MGLAAPSSEERELVFLRGSPVLSIDVAVLGRDGPSPKGFAVQKREIKFPFVLQLSPK